MPMDRVHCKILTWANWRSDEMRHPYRLFQEYFHLLKDWLLITSLIIWFCNFGHITIRGSENILSEGKDFIILTQFSYSTDGETKSQRYSIVWLKSPKHTNNNTYRTKGCLLISHLAIFASLSYFSKIIKINVWLDIVILALFFSFLFI